MPEKQLYQIGWQGGMTEGDVSPQTVQEILNAELDREGKLRPRDEFVPSNTFATNYPLDVIYITDPTNSDNVLRVHLCPESVIIYDNSSDAIVSLMSFATAEGSGVATIDNSSTMFAHGSDIYVITIVDGVPSGIFSISYMTTTAHFGPPALTSGCSYAAERNDGTGSWTMFAPGGLVPNLAVYSVTDTIANVVGTVTWTHTADTYYNDANTWCNGSKNKVALVYKGINDRAISTSAVSEHFTALAADQVISAEYAVQFVFINGAHSLLSNRVSAKANFDITDMHCAIGTTISVASSLSRAVKAINVYRRLIRSGDTVTPDGNMELMYTAHVYSKDLTDLDSAVDSSAVEQKYFEYTNVTSSTDDAGVTGAIVKCTALNISLDVKLPIGHKRKFSGSAKFTSGWFQYFGNTYTFVPKCLIASGTHQVYAGNLTDEQDDAFANAEYYKLQLDDAICIYGRWSNLGSNVECVADDQRLLTPTIGLGSPRNATPYFERYNGGARWLGIAPDIGFTVLKTTAESSVKASCNLDTPSTGTGTYGIASKKPLVLYVDDTQAGYTYEQVSGINENELSVVSPRAATLGSGRMICLNVVQDGSANESRLCYSEFRRPSTFRKSNYIDYGPRDDGYGVALASFAGRLLVLHSTSCYILDISGGSDMAWREIGAYNDVGALSAQAVVTTAVGVFFASQGGVYYFDGDKLTKISQMEGRDITQTYKTLFKGTCRLAWRSDMRQLWVSGGGTTLVFDFDRGAWHKHEFSLETTPTTDLIRFFNIGNVEFSTFWYRPTSTTSAVYTFSLEQPGDTVPFAWGLTTGPIDMGAAEVVKKAKSIYVDTQGATDNALPIGVWYVDGALMASYAPGYERNVKRIRTNVRDYSLNFRVETSTLPGSNQYWAGVIESLGLSYKPKRLK